MKRCAECSGTGHVVPIIPTNMLGGFICPVCLGAGYVGQALEALLQEKLMHYKNGREAKNGDKVVMFPSYGSPVIGILYDAQAGNDYCNGNIAVIRPNDSCPNLKECLHLDDVLKALPAEVPDTSPM